MIFKTVTRQSFFFILGFKTYIFFLWSDFNWLVNPTNYCRITMCWHKDIAKFQILMKIFLNQGLGIQYECRVSNMRFLCFFNRNLVDSITALLAKIFIFCHFYVVEI